jgi:hypothetical protein
MAGWVWGVRRVVYLTDVDRIFTIAKKAGYRGYYLSYYYSYWAVHSGIYFLDSRKLVWRAPATTNRPDCAVSIHMAY